MFRKTWELTDVIDDAYTERISLGPEQVGGPAKGYSVTKRTLRGGLRDGVDMIEVDNGRLWFAVVPTRGMGIWRAVCGDMHLGWKSPVHGPVHPAFVPLWEPSGIGWLSGFDELLGPLRVGEQRGAGVLAQRRAPLSAARQNHQYAGTLREGDDRRRLGRNRRDGRGRRGPAVRRQAPNDHDHQHEGRSTVDHRRRRDRQPLGRAGRTGVAVPHQFRHAAGVSRGQCGVAGQKDGAARRGGGPGPSAMERLRSRDAGPGRGVFLLRSGGRSSGPNAGAVAIGRRPSKASA